jgi:hypothetical protein
MMFGTHHDAPVAFPDSMRVLAATVTRRTRSGDILGPDQRVDVMTALKAMTIWPAWQHFEENEKGSIEAGKIADFVVLSANPATVDPEKLADIKVLVTIKEDAVIYKAEQRADSNDLTYAPLASDPVAAHNILHVIDDGLANRSRSSHPRWRSLEVDYTTWIKGTIKGVIH